VQRQAHNLATPARTLGGAIADTARCTRALTFDEDAVTLELALVVAEMEPEPVTEAVDVCRERG